MSFERWCRENPITLQDALNTTPRDYARAAYEAGARERLAATAAELENAWQEGFEAGQEAANSDKG